MTLNNGSGCTGLSVCSFGCALGVAEAVFLLLFAWAGLFWGYGTGLISDISTIFYGYAPTFAGGLYGAFWGFIDGFIFGVIIAYVYNFCCSRCCKRWCSTDKK